MAVASSDNAVRSSNVTRASIYLVLILFALFYLLPSSGPIIAVCCIRQFTNIWNDFLLEASFASGGVAPMTVALNNPVNSSTGVRECTVHFAVAIMAAAPTLLVYIVAGRCFVRGLMAGSVKG